MNEEKRNRIIGAVTVNAVLLIVIIIAVVVYQIVMISVLADRKSKLLKEYDYYYDLYENSLTIEEKLNASQELVNIYEKLIDIDPSLITSLTTIPAYDPDGSGN